METQTEASANIVNMVNIIPPKHHVNIFSPKTERFSHSGVILCVTQCGWELTEICWGLNSSPLICRTVSASAPPGTMTPND